MQGIGTFESIWLHASNVMGIGTIERITQQFQRRAKLFRDGVLFQLVDGECSVAFA